MLAAMPPPDISLPSPLKSQPHSPAHLPWSQQHTCALKNRSGLSYRSHMCHFAWGAGTTPWLAGLEARTSPAASPLLAAAFLPPLPLLPLCITILLLTKAGKDGLSPERSQVTYFMVAEDTIKVDPKHWHA